MSYGLPMASPSLLEPSEEASGIHDNTFKLITKYDVNILMDFNSRGIVRDPLNTSTPFGLVALMMTSSFRLQQMWISEGEYDDSVPTMVYRTNF